VAPSPKHSLRPATNRTRHTSSRQGTDLFDIGGAALEDLLTEAGDVDPDAVKAAVADLLASRPGLKVPDAISRRSARRLWSERTRSIRPGTA